MSRILDDAACILELRFPDHPLLHREILDETEYLTFCRLCVPRLLRHKYSTEAHKPNLETFYLGFLTGGAFLGGTLLAGLVAGFAARSTSFKLREHGISYSYHAFF